MIQAVVAVEYRDVHGLHPVGTTVWFPSDDQAAVDHLIETGILAPPADGPLEAPTLILPDPAPEPTEGVKEKTARGRSSRARRS